MYDVTQSLVAQDALVPLRAEPSHRAEQLTELLFGEGAEALATQGTWVQLRLAHDGQEGWAVAGSLAPAPLGWVAQSLTVAAPALLLQVTEQGQQGPLLFRQAISMGARLPRPDASELWLGTRHYELAPLQDPEDSFLGAGEHYLPDQLPALMVAWLGTPYRWGGRSAWGVDCSGLVQIAYRFAGLELPHSAARQAQHPTAQEVAWEELQTGDLAFFGAEPGAITHVGLYAGPDALGEGSAPGLLHATEAGGVRWDVLTPQGIVHSVRGHLTHPLLSLRTFPELTSLI